MRLIPPKLKADMEADPFYKQCCVTGYRFEKIEWHHNFIFAGKQVNEKWCILPLIVEIHKNIGQNREVCDWIMLNRADDATLKKYSRSQNLIAKRNRLNAKFGKWVNPLEPMPTA